MRDYITNPVLKRDLAIAERERYGLPDIDTFEERFDRLMAITAENDSMVKKHISDIEKTMAK
jgi:hypothetical protein